MPDVEAKPKKPFQFAYWHLLVAVLFLSFASWVGVKVYQDDPQVEVFVYASADQQTEENLQPILDGESHMAWHERFHVQSDGAPSGA